MAKVTGGEGGGAAAMQMPWVEVAGEQWKGEKTESMTDSVLGSVNQPHGLRVVVDTPEVQRLRKVNQLGVADHVYPSATHTRFAHSIGVAHLGAETGRHLQKVQPELGVTDKDILCLAIAGLCHDLGHGPFSHTFEVFLRKWNVDWHHEQMSVRLTRRILQRPSVANHLKGECNLINKDFLFIEELISPPPEGQEKGRGKDKLFLYEIIANARNGFDVDKLDYFLRDSQATCMAVPFNTESVHRLLQNTRVLPDPKGRLRLSYPLKVTDILAEIGITRQMLHQKVYNHKTVLAMEYLLGQTLGAAHKAKFTLKGVSLLDIVKEGNEEVFLELDNHILSAFRQDMKMGSEVAELLKAMAERRLPKLIMALEVEKSEQSSHLSEKTLENELGRYTGIAPENFHVRKAAFDYGKKGKEPLHDVLFHREMWDSEKKKKVFQVIWGKDLKLEQRRCLKVVVYIYFLSQLTAEIEEKVRKAVEAISANLNVALSPRKYNDTKTSRPDTPLLDTAALSPPPPKLPKLVLPNQLSFPQ